VQASGLRVELRAQPAVNLALLHNRVPLITQLVVSNESSAPITGLRVAVHLEGVDEESPSPWSRFLPDELPPGHAASWSDLHEVAPALDHLRVLNESHPAAIVARVTRESDNDVILRVPIQVLAQNEWFNAPIFYDSLAAFVQPNTTAVSSVLDRAATLLRDQTSSASLDGYQHGPERAALIAAAVYEALRTYDIRYICPPASFEITGQKVRTTAQVLEERFGTCIDLAVTYAACIEQAGLRPVIWLSDGHAFCGFMRDAESLKHPSTLTPNTMVNLYESHRAVAIEAMYYQQGAEGSFRAAVHAARKHFLEPGGLRALIDVSAARRDGIKPLPTRLEDTHLPIASAPDAVSTPVLDLPPELKAGAIDDAVFDSRDTAPPRVRRWKRALLDLSTRNRLLNLRPSAQVIDLVTPADGLVVLQDLIHGGKRISIAAHDDLSAIHLLQGARTAREVDDDILLRILGKDKTVFAAVGEDVYARRFKRLQRDARTLLEETGASNLYLAFGSLIHTTSTGAEARAPLFLLPVELVGGTGRSAFEVSVDSANVFSPNHCLVEWLRLRHNVAIESLSSPPRDETGIDIESALIGIRTALVELNLNFRVDETAVLAICQFGTFGMWKDLNDAWNVLSQSSLVDHLTHRPGETFIDPSADTAQLDTLPVDETAEPTPIPADGSQLRAIELSAAGRTFVLEGPPGTGKSQTITNLIARNLVAGRSVLFVAEKQAALDVVKRRLDAIGLSPFTLDLHGRNQTAVQVRNQLRESIEYRLDYNDRVWEALLTEYRSKHEPLDEYPERIHAPNAYGDSLWDAYDTVLAFPLCQPGLRHLAPDI
jgi:hypothetical protein